MLNIFIAQLMIMILSGTEHTHRVVINVQSYLSDGELTFTAQTYLCLWIKCTRHNSVICEHIFARGSEKRRGLKQLQGIGTRWVCTMWQELSGV